jgi:cation diffusion facilitator CzcD-associated flavoprotein CzcO
MSRTPSVVVIGAGMSGIYLGRLLKEAGVDFSILEKASSVGGVWRENRYPGIACDVPSRYYTYPDEPNPDWTHYTAPGQEVHDYFERCARKYGLMAHIQFSQEVVSATFEDGRWTLRTRAGHTCRADFVITATGVLHHPRLPVIAGLNSFEGQAFHSAQWPDSIDLHGKRVAVVGTGSTGVQIVSTIASEVDTLTHFQRTPQWIFPMPNRRTSRFVRWVLRHNPALDRLAYHIYRKSFGWFFGRVPLKDGFLRKLLHHACALHLRVAVHDRELRERLTPNYEAGCKRQVLSTKFYPTLQRGNVEVVTDKITHIAPNGIATGDGRFHNVDVIVFATGFYAQHYIRPIEVTGGDGTSLEELWRDVPVAYRTVGLPGCPNFFMMSGPHCPIGNSSLIDTAVVQADYIVQWIRLWSDEVYDLATPTHDATDAYNTELRNAYPGEIVWSTGGCVSAYMGKDGMPSLWPWLPARYAAMLSRPNFKDFHLQKFDTVPLPTVTRSERL